MIAFRFRQVLLYYERKTPIFSYIRQFFVSVHVRVGTSQHSGRKISFLVNKANLVHNFSQYVYFFSLHVSGWVCAHHQEKQLYLCITWYLLFCMIDCLVCRVDVHPAYQTVSCRINTVISPDDGHTVVRNMWRKEINILRKIVHQVGFIYKIIQGYSDTSANE